MADILLFLIVVILFGVMGLAIFKYRAQFRKWIHDPKYGSSWYTSRETHLEREIEDANAELEWLRDKAETEGD